MTTSSQHPSSPADGDPIDLGPLFTTPQITTDEHGVHRDETGREYRAFESGGEVQFLPVPQQRQVAAWVAPAWATSTTIDEGFVAHEVEAVTTVRVGLEGRTREIRVAATVCDSLLDDGGRVVVRRDLTPDIGVDTLSLSPHEARRLITALTEVLDALGGVA